MRGRGKGRVGKGERRKSGREREGVYERSKKSVGERIISFATAVSLLHLAGVLLSVSVGTMLQKVLQ